MTASWVRGALVVVAVGGAAAAVIESTNPNVALAAGLVAGAAAALVAGIELSAHLYRPAAGPEAGPAVDTLAAYRAAFRGSAIARERVIAALATLDRTGGNRPPLPRERAAEIAAASPEEFRAFVRRELDRLEAET